MDLVLQLLWRNTLLQRVLRSHQQGVDVGGVDGGRLGEGGREGEGAEEGGEEREAGVRERKEKGR